MCDKIITVTEHTSSKEALRSMAEHHIRWLPVLNNDRLVGIVPLGYFATRELTDEMAGRALSEISEPDELHDGVQH